MNKRFVWKITRIEKTVETRWRDRANDISRNDAMQCNAMCTKMDMNLSKANKKIGENMKPFWNAVDSEIVFFRVSFLLLLLCSADLDGFQIRHSL